MRKIIRFFVTLFILILLIAAITFGVLFYVKNNEVVTANARSESLASELAVSKQKVTELETTCTGECPTMLEFVDKEQNIEFDYPVSWKVEVSTNIGELVYEIPGQLGRVLTSYQIIASKGSATLTYDRVLVATGFTPQPVSTDDEFKILSDDIARLKRKGSSDWSYVAYEDCPEEMTAEKCYLTAANGFGDGAKTVVLKGVGTDATLLDEADAIVLSAQ